MKLEQSSEYWKERFEQLEQSQHKRGMQCYAEIEKQYRKAQYTLEGKIAAWYQKFADNNSISIVDAKKMLAGRELEEFKWDVQDYIRHGKENSVNQKWVKQLENASSRYHVSRLEALKLHIQQSMEIMFRNQLDLIDLSMRDIYTKGYYNSMYEIQRGFGIGHNFALIDERKIYNVINRPWAVDGKNFSTRIWEDKQELINVLHTELTQNIILGQDPQKAINAIIKKLDAPMKAAGRLVMTEEAFFSSAAQGDCFNELGVTKYEIVATMDSHTSDICRALDGKVFDMKDYNPGITAPPFHCWCRTCTVPWFDDDFGVHGERAARNEDGENYYIPANMTYKEWEEKYVHNGKNSSEKGNKEETADYLVRSHTPGENTTKLRILANDVIAGMPDNVQNAIHMGTIIDLGKNGASQYDYSRDILYVSKNSSKGEIIHEIGHIVDSKILNSDIVSAIRRDTIGDVGICDIKATTYYDSDGNPKDIFCIDNEKLISEYQGRIYVDNIFNAFDGDGKFRDDLLWEFISEAFREYIENPVNLSTHSQKIFDLIKEGME